MGLLYRKVRSGTDHRCKSLHFIQREVYRSPILNLYNSNLVDYTVSERTVRSMVTSMLKRIIQELQDGIVLILGSGVVAHSAQITNSFGDLNNSWLKILSDFLRSLQLAPVDYY